MAGEEKTTFEKAETALVEGDYKGAVNLFDIFLHNFPDSTLAPHALFKVGYIYNRFLDNKKKAIETFDMLLYLYPKTEADLDAREELAGIHSFLGEHEKAIAEYAYLLEKSPTRKRDKYRFDIAMEYMKINNFSQARVEFNDILKTAQASTLTPIVYYQIANSYYIEGDAEGALKAYDEVISRFKNHAIRIEALLGKAIVLEELSRPNEALALLNDIKGEYKNSDVIKIRVDSIMERLREKPGVRK